MAMTTALIHLTRGRITHIEVINTPKDQARLALRTAAMHAAGGSAKVVRELLK
jgi:hypothetical protein